MRDAASRRNAPVATVSPRRFVAFDVLAVDGDAVIDGPYSERRALLDGLGLDGPHGARHRNFTRASLTFLTRVTRMMLNASAAADMRHVT